MHPETESTAGTDRVYTVFTDATLLMKIIFDAVYCSWHRKTEHQASRSLSSRGNAAYSAFPPSLGHVTGPLPLVPDPRRKGPGRGSLRALTTPNLSSFTPPPRGPLRDTAHLVPTRRS